MSRSQLVEVWVVQGPGPVYMADMTKCISTKGGPITLGFGASVPLIGAH
jgi:hypothetical protein